MPGRVFRNIKEIKAKVFKAVLRSLLSELRASDLSQLSRYWEIPLEVLEEAIIERKGLPYEEMLKAYYESTCINLGFSLANVGRFYLLTKPEDRGRFAAWLKEEHSIELSISDLPNLS